jgi:hypothetical protein
MTADIDKNLGSMLSLILRIFGIRIFGPMNSIYYSKIRIHYSQIRIYYSCGTHVKLFLLCRQNSREFEKNVRGTHSIVIYYLNNNIIYFLPLHSEERYME